MDSIIHITPPLSDATVMSLNAGDMVEITGVIYTARDAAHKRFFELLDRGEPLPFDVTGQIIYYVGPTPARPGNAIGCAGPTTASRMDVYAPRLLEKGLKGMIGKGEMGSDVAQALQRHKGVYFAAIGGAGALIARSIKSSRIIAYEDLGTEAVRELYVEGFEVMVAQDCKGGNVFISGREQYAVHG
jgi:fumarate hydratase subunit beta